MRRLPVLVALVALLLSVLPLSAALASPGDVAEDGVLILAVDDDEDGPAGPDPAPRLQEDNAATTLSGYESPDVPFTWGAAWILSFAGLVGLALLIGFYMLLVRRPSQGS